MRNDFTERFVSCVAEDDEPRGGEIFREQPDESGEMFCRPAFGLPARAGVESDQMRGAERGVRSGRKCGGPFAFYDGGDLRPVWQPLEIFVNGHSEWRQRGQIPDRKRTRLKSSHL